MPVPLQRTQRAAFPPQWHFTSVAAAPLPPQLEHFPVAPQSKHPVIIDITGSFWSGPANAAWYAIWVEALRDRGTTDREARCDARRAFLSVALKGLRGAIRE